MFTGVYAESDNSITEAAGMKISVSGNISIFNAPIIIVNGVLMAPIEELVDKLGVKDDDVDIFSNFRNGMTAIIEKDDGFVIIETDSKTAVVNNKPVELDAAPPIYKDKIYVPVIFMAQNLGKKAVWDAAKSTVFIYNSDNSITETTKMKVDINGEMCTFNGPLIIVDETLMAPLKELAAKLGVKDDDVGILSSFNNNMIATIDKRGYSILITTGSKSATVNSEQIKLSAAPSIYKGQLYVPVRFIAQNLGKKVEWDAATSTVIISDIVLPDPTGWKRMNDRPKGNESQKDKQQGTVKGISWVIISSNDQNKAVVIDNKVYMIDNDGTVREYDPTADIWADKGKIEALQNSKGFFKLVTMNKKILVVGANFSDVLEYDIYTNQCTLKTKLPSPRAIGAALVEKGKLYILSGSLVGDASTLNSLDVYDPVTNTWAKKKGMFSGANDLTTATVNGKIYIFGAVRSGGIIDPITKDTYHGQNIEVYDIKKDTWQYINPPRGSYFVSGAEVINGKLYLFGDGLDKGDVKVYDPQNNEWRYIADMLPKEYGYATATVNGKIYVIEGNKVEQFTPQNLEAR